MYCPDCGSEVAEGRKFCGKCGGQLNVATQIIETHQGGPNTSAAVAPARVREVAPVVAAPAGSKSFMAKIVPFLILLVLAAAGGAWWWSNRPAPANQIKDPGLYPVSVEGKWGYADAQGNLVIQGNEAQPLFLKFSEDLCTVIKNGKWGYMDRTGKMVISPQFDLAADFENGLAMVGLSGNGKLQLGYIDKTGSYVINPQFEQAHGFRDGRAAVQSQGKWGYVDTTGKFVIKPSFGGAGNFEEGLAPVHQNGQSGFIDRNGKLQIKSQFQAAGSFADGLAPVRSGSQWGYIDHSGKLVINPQFDNVSQFHDGLAWVSVSGKTGTIDKKGKFVLNPGQYDLALLSPCCDDLYELGINITHDLQVRSNDGVGVISRSGTWILQPSKAVQQIFHIYQSVVDLQVAGERCLVTKQGNVIFGRYKGSALATVALDIDNETSALGTMRVLTLAEASYSSTNPVKGFTASLDKLGPAIGSPDENHAGFVDAALATGTKNGYQFAVNIPEGTSTGGTNFNYFIVAKPVAGHVGRTFCADSSGVVRYAVQGAECTTTSPTL